MIKFELVQTPYNGSGECIQLTLQMRDVRGVLPSQLVEDKKLSVERFPGNSAADVKGFTSDAKSFER